MTTSKPPKFFSSIFNSYYYTDEDTTEFTQDQADLRYLRKTTTDTASGIISFNAGLETDTINPISTTNKVNLFDTQTGVLNIGTSTSRSTNAISIGHISGATVNVANTQFTGNIIKTDGSIRAPALQSATVNGH